MGKVWMLDLISFSNQFASSIDRTGKITNFTENCAGKSFLFSEDSKETCP